MHNPSYNKRPLQQPRSKSTTTAVRWGILGCGNVAETKSGPGFQKARHSELIAVMRRDSEKAADFARRHRVPRFYDHSDDLIKDPQVDAVYISTPPSSHSQLALKVAAARKPCLVEKPMAMTHSECMAMTRAFQKAEVPLFVAYYRRALPRFLKVRELLKNQIVGQISSVRITHYDPLVLGEACQDWRFNPVISGGGLFMDLASHGLDLLDFLIGPIKTVSGLAVNTGGSYTAEDVTAICFEFECGIVGTGIWNFNANYSQDQIIFMGSKGELECPVFSDTNILLRQNSTQEAFHFRNPPHVHQPLIQSIVNQLIGEAHCASTAESGARTSRIMEQCLQSHYATPERK